MMNEPLWPEIYLATLRSYLNKAVESVQPVLHWYLLQYKPNSHNLAVRNLVRQGFETFLPLEKATKRRATRFRNELRPVFPGYMFVSFDEHQAPWRKINGTLGVSRLVNFAGTPKPVPNELIDRLRARCNEEGQLLPDASLKTGDSVKINTGPFANFVATIEKLEPDQRAWVLLDLMGQETRVELAKNQLAAV